MKKGEIFAKEINDKDLEQAAGGRVTPFEKPAYDPEEKCTNYFSNVPGLIGGDCITCKYYDRESEKRAYK